KRSIRNLELRFDTGSTKLRPESQQRLNNLADTLKKYPDVHMKVAGYTDNVGNPDKNVELSRQRANTVMAILVRKGVPEAQVTAEGYGEEHPIAENATPQGRAKNRRVTVETE